MSDSLNTSVRVCLRVRPLLPYEISANASKVLTFPQPTSLVIDHQSSPRPFTFDYVFDDFASQDTVYEGSVRPLVDSYLSGYNATILAYGQTGSGKTFTMGTAASEEIRDDVNTGIIPRVIKDIFRAIYEKEATHTFLVKCAFLEIYNEEIKDLLATKTGGPAPYIREGPNNSIIVANTIEETVESYNSMMALLIRGSQNRVVGSTAMNAASSRSHAIFSIILSQKRNDSGGGNSDSGDLLAQVDETLISKFHFVDLAGSERLKRTGAVGERMKEGININQGLLALGNCISALGGATKAAHVPFRDSKITRMLQDSLGGNSQTLMIACVSPADVNADESLNTLKYANRAKNIQNKPVINRDPVAAKMDALRQRVMQLEHACQAYAAGNNNEAESILAHVGPLTTSTNANTGTQSLPPPSHRSSLSAQLSSEELSLIKDQNLTYEMEVKRLTDKVKEMRDEMNQLGDRAVHAEIQRDAFRFKFEQATGIVSHGSTDKQNGHDNTDASALPAIEAKDLSVIEENCRLIHKMARKIAYQKKELTGAIRIIEAMQSTGGLTPHLSSSPASQSTRKRRKRRGTRSKIGSNEASVNTHAVEGATMSAGESDDGEDAGATDSDIDVSRSILGDSMLDDDDTHTANSMYANIDTNISDVDSAAEEGDSLSILAELKAQEHEANLRHFTAAEASLNADLSSKTKQLKDFQAQSSHVAFLKTQYEKKIQDMEKEMECVIAERDRVLKELEVNGKTANASPETDAKYQQAVNQYRQQLTALSDQLKQYKDKLKENERIKKQLKDDEVRIKKLELEISTAKKAKVALAKRMEDAQLKYKEWCDLKELKMATMAKEQRKDKILIKKLEQEFEKQRNVLQRRNEEKAALQKQIKTQTGKIQQAQASHASNNNSSNNHNLGHSQNVSRSNNASSNNSRAAQAAKPPRATPMKSRMTKSRRARDSPAARAKAQAIAANAAALSDSAAPQHGSAYTVHNDEQVQSAIESEISAAVDRAVRMKQLQRCHDQRVTLQVEYNDICQQLENTVIDAAIPTTQQQYSALEQKCAELQSAIASMDQTIRMKEQEMARLTQASPLKKPVSGSRVDDSIGGGFLNGSDIDYRLFSRIRINSLDTGKRALVYLLHQAVDLNAEHLDNEKEVEKLKNQLHDKEKLMTDMTAKYDAAIRVMKGKLRLKTSQFQVHYSVISDSANTISGADDQSPRRVMVSRAHSPIPTSPAPSTHALVAHSSPGLNTATIMHTNDTYDVTEYHPSSITSSASSTCPIMTNNYITDDTNLSVEIEHIANANKRAAVPTTKTKGDVFTRLVNPDSYTGMYAKIQEDAKQKNKLPQITKKPSMTHTQKQSQEQHKLNSTKHANQVQLQSQSVAPLRQLVVQDSPLLASISSASAASSLDINATGGSRPQSQQSASVFSRLTNPANFTGASRARLGLDVQPKHKAGEESSITGSLSHTSATTPSHHSTPSIVASHSTNTFRAKLSPSRGHSRQGSGHEFASTFDSATLASSLHSNDAPGFTIHSSDSFSHTTEALIEDKDHGDHERKESARVTRLDGVGSPSTITPRAISYNTNTDIDLSTVGGPVFHAQPDDGDEYGAQDDDGGEYDDSDYAVPASGTRLAAQ